MYKILIVDDEKIERESIRFLIGKFQFPLEIYEANNGECALASLQSGNYDILFTDIKMPFMDGLELSSRAKKISPELVVIIFSAYGEFDYAKEAIKNNVFSYLLKPVNIDEFNDVIKRVIARCDKLAEEKKRQVELSRGFSRYIAHEKEKLLIDLANGIGVDEGLGDKLAEKGLLFSRRNMVMILIDTSEKVFQTKPDEIKQFLSATIDAGYEYVNINESQSLLFLANDGPKLDKKRIETVIDSLTTGFTLNWSIRVCFVVSRVLNSLSDYHNEFLDMQELLDAKFFSSQNLTLYNGLFMSNPSSTDNTAGMDEIKREISYAIRCNNIQEIQKGVGKAYAYLARNQRISSIYAKYIFSEIIKEVLESWDIRDILEVNRMVSEAFKIDDLAILKEYVDELVSKIDLVRHQPILKSSIDIIEKVKYIIETEYMQEDIGLDYIASKVYLNPSYLSHLFRRKTLQSIIKYITDFRMNKAALLLSKCDMKISDVSEKVGYSNNPYFCTLFKNYFGISPVKYREKCSVSEHANADFEN